MKKILLKFPILKHPLFSGSVIMVGGNMIVNVVNYVYHLVMGRVLGPVDYGILASIYSVLYIVSIVPASASVAVVKFISSAKSKDEASSIYRRLFSFVLYLGIFSSLVLLILSPLVAQFLHISDLKILFLVPVILFFSLVTLVNQSTSQGLLRFTGSVLPNLISALTKLILGLVLIFLGWSVFGAIFAIVIGAVLAYLYSAWFIRSLVKKGREISFDLRPFFKYSLPVLIQAFAFTSLFTTDLILVKHFLSPFQAGIYAALSTLGKIIFFAVSPVMGTMFPIVAGRKSRGEAYEKIFFVSFGITLAISLAVVTFYWLFPDIAIGLLYGKAYLEARSELVWMGIFILFYTLSNLLVNFALSLGKTTVTLFPFIAAILQVAFLWAWHKNLHQVIEVSLFVTIALFFVLIFYLGYNRLRSYEKR